jgi:hypothetical protein
MMCFVQAFYGSDQGSHTCGMAGSKFKENTIFQFIPDYFTNVLIFLLPVFRGIILSPFFESPVSYYFFVCLKKVTKKPPGDQCTYVFVNTVIEGLEY